MENVLPDSKAKELIAQVLTEMIKDDKAAFRQIVAEVIEEGPANAIAEGRRNEFVPESEILDALGR